MITFEEEAAALVRAIEARADAQRLTRNANARRRHAAAADRKNAAARRIYAELSGPDRLFRASKARAKREGVPFRLTSDYIRSIWPQDGRCPVFGFRMLFGDEHDQTPSLDRYQREVGYVPNNVKVISMRANRLRSDASPMELEKLAVYAVEVQRSIMNAGHTEGT